MNIFKKLKVLKVLTECCAFYEIYKAGIKSNVWRFENTYLDESKIALIKEYLIEQGRKKQ